MTIEYAIKLLGAQTEPVIWEGSSVEECVSQLDGLPDYSLTSSWVTAWDMDEIDAYGVPELLGQISGEEFAFAPHDILGLNVD